MSKIVDGRVIEIHERDIEVSVSGVVAQVGKNGMSATLYSADIESIVNQISTDELLAFIGREEVKNWLDDSGALSVAAS